jgi:hypothetical protein
MAKPEPVSSDILERMREETNEFMPYGIERVGRFERVRRPPDQEGRPRPDVEKLLALRGKVKLDLDIDELRGRPTVDRDRRR